ncbi:MAG: D-aminoacyl-tRNA deacylase [Thermoflexales bacterium]
MRVVLQRVLRASVSVNHIEVAAIGKGVLLLVGITHDDTPQRAEWMARKVSTLRIFPSDSSDSGFDKSLTDVGGEVLVVSQFTLYGEARKGRRPDFVAAARPELAAPLIEQFTTLLRQHGLAVQEGVFGADMQVSLVNDGPVTLILEAP